MRDANWDDLRFVAEAARAGTFAAAARALRVNESTVARRVARAERALAAPVFERRAGRLALTQAGRALCDAAETMKETHRRAFSEPADAGAARGLVRLTAAAVIANHALAPAIGALTAAHPGLAVEVIAEAADLSVLDREVDIALRLARPAAAARAIARRLADLTYRAYAAAADGRGADCPWIAYGERMAHVPQRAWISQAAERGRLAPVSVSDAETLLACIRTGAGRGYLPAFAGDADPALRRVDAPERKRELWLIVDPAQRRFPRIRAVADWAAETIAKLP